MILDLSKTRGMCDTWYLRQPDVGGERWIRLQLLATEGPRYREKAWVREDGGEPFCVRLAELRTIYGVPEPLQAHFQELSHAEGLARVAAAARNRPAILKKG